MYLHVAEHDLVEFVAFEEEWYNLTYSNRI